MGDDVDSFVRALRRENSRNQQLKRAPVLEGTPCIGKTPVQPLQNLRKVIPS